MTQIIMMDLPPHELQDQHNSSQKHIDTVRTEYQPADNMEEYLESYKLHQNFFTKEDLRSQPSFTMVKGKNYMYFGGFVDHMKHGYGLLVAGDTIYQGTFKLNLKMGKGYLKFSSGATYTGDFVNSKPHGSGTFTYPSEQCYVGDFQNGLIHGNGMWTSPKGDRYIGQWKNNKADGHGIHVWINGDKYQGQFKEFLKHGYGVEKFANGDSYKGNYEGGKPNGYGEYYWSNGSVFKGQFKSGLRHGKGEWRKGEGEGDSYEGEYQNDKKCGFGVFKWSSGNLYKGEFFDDLRHGQGEMYWSDGSYYKGTWERGVQNGKGTICLAGKSQRSGQFQNNVLIMQDPPSTRPINTNPLIDHSPAKSSPGNIKIKKVNNFQYDQPEKLRNLDQLLRKNKNKSTSHRSTKSKRESLQIYRNVWNSNQYFCLVPVNIEKTKQKKKSHSFTIKHKPHRKP